MIEVVTDGSYDKTTAFLERLASGDIFSSLDRFGQIGVDALSAATPILTGLASSSWGYTITKGSGFYRIAWFNENVEGGENVAVLLQYGHGTGTGGYVEGRDYINPAMRPIFDDIIAEFIKEVTR